MPTNQACVLSSLVCHAQHWLDEHPGSDPAVLVNINGAWCPVFAGIEETGDHRNAVKIDYLEAAVRYATQGRHGDDWVDVETFGTLDEAQMAFASVGKYPMDRSYRIVKRTYFGAAAEGKYTEEVVL